MEAGQPSFTAMIHASMRAEHATRHQPPIYSDTLSVELVPEEVLALIEERLSMFTQAALDALWLMAVIRHRVFAGRLDSAYERGVRQFVILGAGLDTTGFQLPKGAESWSVFEVDHPATQEWKRRRIAEVGWEVPANLVFAPCDFERDDLLNALGAVGFQRDHPAIVSWFGVVTYLTVEATTATLGDLATLARGSEVTFTYSEPPDLSDEVVREFWEKAKPIAAAAGESFIGYYTEEEMDALVRRAGFTQIEHHPIEQLDELYFRGRSDGLRLCPIERLLTATL